MSSELLFCKKEQGSVISHGWVLQSPLTWINSQRLLAFKINSTSIRVKHIIYFIISDNFRLLWHFDNVKPRPNNHNISQHLTQHLQAPAKRSQHFSTTYHNIVGRNNAFGHPVATCCAMLGIENRTSAHARVQHSWTNLAKRLQQHATSTIVI